MSLPNTFDNSTVSLGIEEQELKKETMTSGMINFNFIDYQLS